MDRGGVKTGVKECFFYNLGHFGPVLFHVAHQLELGAAAVQVLAPPGGIAEIVIALQIIGQKAIPPHSRSHEDLAPQGRVSFSRSVRALPAACKSALGVALEQGQAEVYPGEVRFVLGAVVGAESGSSP